MLLEDAVGRQPDRVLVAFGFQELVDLGVGEGSIGTKVAAKVALPVAGHDRFEHVPPAIRRMDVARSQRALFEVAELVEHEQRMVAGAGEVAVVGGAFLFAMGRTDTRIHIENDGPRRAQAMNGVDPLPGETGGVIGRCVCGWLEVLGAALRADGETRSVVTASSIRRRAQHGAFFWTGRIGQGDQRLHCRWHGQDGAGSEGGERA